MKATAATSVDAFIAGFPTHVQDLLVVLRNAIHQAAPQATETISYRMPAYKLHGALVYFSAYKGHIGFYPGASGVANFSDELKSYKTAKGSIQFPLDADIPVDLVQRIVRFRVQENLQKHLAKQSKKR